MTITLREAAIQILNLTSHPPERPGDQREGMDMRLGSEDQLIADVIDIFKQSDCFVDVPALTESIRNSGCGDIIPMPTHQLPHAVRLVKLPNGVYINPAAVQCVRSYNIGGKFQIVVTCDKYDCRIDSIEASEHQKTLAEIVELIQNEAK